MFRFLTTKDRIVESTKEEILTALSAAGVDGCNVMQSSRKWIWLIERGNQYAYVCKVESGEIVDIRYAYTVISDLLPHMFIDDSYDMVISDLY